MAGRLKPMVFRLLTPFRNQFQQFSGRKSLQRNGRKGGNIDTPFAVDRTTGPGRSLSTPSPSPLLHRRLFGSRKRGLPCRPCCRTAFLVFLGENLTEKTLKSIETGLTMTGVIQMLSISSSGDEVEG